MKQHFPQYTLAVLLGLVLAGCHGPEYSDQVYDEDKLYEYDNDEGNTIRGWTVACDGPAIRLEYGGVLYNGQLYGSAEIRTARNLGVDGVTFYHSSTLHISSDGSTTICNFLCDDSAISSLPNGQCGNRLPGGCNRFRPVRHQSLCVGHKWHD